MNKKIKAIFIFLALSFLIFLEPNAQPVFDLKNLKPSDLIEAGKHIKEAVEPMSEAEELELGRSVSARLAGNFGVWKDSSWTSYINIVGRSLVPYSSRPDIKYRFAILDTDEVNAYSAPGGYIFISRGLLKQVESEAELAGILAHEIGHISERHVVKEVQKSHIYQAGARIAVGMTDLNSSQREALNKLTDVAWDVLVVKGFTKEDEYKADQCGARNAYRLGYDPYELLEFLSRLKKREENPEENLKILFSTHPKPSLRISQLEKYLLKEDIKRGYGIVIRDEFQAFKKAHPIP